MRRWAGWTWHLQKLKSGTDEVLHPRVQFGEAQGQGKQRQGHVEPVQEHKRGLFSHTPPEGARRVPQIGRHIYSAAQRQTQATAPLGALSYLIVIIDRGYMA